MAANNVVNINTKGILIYDGAGTYTYSSSLFGDNVLKMDYGGVNLVSTTAYAPLCQQSSSTSNPQGIGLGSSGQVLTSLGSGFQPTFQTMGGGGIGYIIFSNNNSFNPADATTYWQQANGNTPSTSQTIQNRYYFPKDCTIVGAYGSAVVKGTLATTENSTLSIRKNNTADTTITSTLKFSTASNTFSNTFTISMTAGDYMEIKLLTPTWTTNPTTVSWALSVVCI